MVEYPPELSYLKEGFVQHALAGFDREMKCSLQPQNPKKRCDFAIMFGGIIENKLIPNDVFRIKLTGNKAIYEKVETTGVPPCSRYNHTMTFMKNQNILCIFGGQGQEIETSKMKAYIHIIHLQTFAWHAVCVRHNREDPFERRYAHCAVPYKDNLIIYLGINSGGFCEASLDVVTIEENPKYGEDEVLSVEDYGENGGLENELKDPNTIMMNNPHKYSADAIQIMGGSPQDINFGLGLGDANKQANAGGLSKEESSMASATLIRLPLGLPNSSNPGQVALTPVKGGFDRSRSLLAEPFDGPSGELVQNSVQDQALERISGPLLLDNSINQSGQKIIRRSGSIASTGLEVYPANSPRKLEPTTTKLLKSPKEANKPVSKKDKAPKEELYSYSSKQKEAITNNPSDKRSSELTRFLPIPNERSASLSLMTVPGNAHSIGKWRRIAYNAIPSRLDPAVLVEPAHLNKNSKVQKAEDSQM